MPVAKPVVDNIRMLNLDVQIGASPVLHGANPSLIKPLTATSFYVYGKDFADGDVVYIGAYECSTGYVGPGLLEAAVGAPGLSQVGYFDLRVKRGEDEVSLPNYMEVGRDVVYLTKHAVQDFKFVRPVTGDEVVDVWKTGGIRRWHNFITLSGWTKHNEANAAVFELDGHVLRMQPNTNYSNSWDDVFSCPYISRLVPDGDKNNIAIWVHVTEFIADNNWEQFGVVFKDDDSGMQNWVGLDFGYNTGNKFVILTRTIDNVSMWAASVDLGPGGDFPTDLLLMKTGDLYKGYYSADGGQSWILVGTFNGESAGLVIDPVRLCVKIHPANELGHTYVGVDYLYQSGHFRCDTLVDLPFVAICEAPASFNYASTQFAAGYGFGGGYKENGVVISDVSGTNFYSAFLNYTTTAAKLKIDKWVWDGMSQSVRTELYSYDLPATVMGKIMNVGLYRSGSVLKARYWEKGTAELVWQIEGSDSALAGLDYIGLFTGGPATILGDQQPFFDLRYATL